MALISNINIDLASQTVNIIATVGADSVETITYDKTTNVVTFSARAGLIVTFSEWLAFADQVNIYQTAILFNFPTTDSTATKPFDKIISNEFHDTGAGNWNFTVSPLSGDDIVSYEATKSSLKFSMNPRSSDVTITFPEWILFLQVFNHYRISVKQF